MGRYDDPQPKSPLIAIIGAVVALIAALAIWMLSTEKGGEQPPRINELPLPAAESLNEEPEEEVVEPTAMRLMDVEQEQREETLTSEAQANGALQEQSLPALQDSDDLFRQQITALSGDLTELLQADDLIEKYLYIVNDFSEGQRLYKHMKFLVLPEPFVPGKDEQGLYMSARNYHRYDRLAQAFAAIDNEAAIRAYRRLRPLLQQVYIGFSYPEHYQLEDLFKKAAAEVIAAPIIEDRIALVRPTVRYKFADQTLENLSPVQKQMLRMGPENTRIIQKKLRELVQEMTKFQVE